MTGVTNILIFKVQHWGKYNQRIRPNLITPDINIYKPQKGDLIEVKKLPGEIPEV